MPLQATSGAASYDAFGGGVAAVPNYIEDVFSTYLYTGNGATGQAINNGINLSTKGGLVWLKSRSTPSGSSSNNLYDTVRGASQLLISNSTDAQTTATRLSFQTTGFNLTNEASSTNESGVSYASWTFRKQPKFFDVVTWTGSGANRTIAHNLGSVPACIMVKRTDTTAAWAVYHRSLANTEYLVLNTTAAKATGATYWNSTTPTSTVFSLGTNASVNASGGTYVAYVFAHDAGGFGLTGTDNVISCGSYTGNGSATGPSITLGYEPQWVLVKSSTVAGSHWYLMDTMRGMAQTVCNELYANLDAAEITQSKTIIPTATGFDVATTDSYINNNGSTYIYIAIRRGPMKVPTSGTSVFTPLTYTNPGTGTTITSLSFPADVVFTERRDASAHRPVWDRLRGATKAIYTNLTGAEGTVTDGLTNFASNVGYTVVSDNAVDGSQVNYVFRRAPSFFDEVCYTGTGVARTVAHNLGVVPELMIVKNRSIASDWRAYSASLGATQNLKPNTTDAATSSTLIWNDTAPTSSVFTVGTVAGVNGSGNNMVAYLFATCAGVSKMTTFTGNGSSQTINCGFTGGARFVLIKRVDSTGNWVTFDTARGIVSGNDPALYLNSTAAEVTGVDAIDPDSTGFIVNQESTFNLNVSSATYLVLAIA